jgi:hypothetical protein
MREFSAQARIAPVAVEFHIHHVARIFQRRKPGYVRVNTLMARYRSLFFKR